jgi:hypothetical protein
MREIMKGLLISNIVLFKGTAPHPIVWQVSGLAMNEM